MSSGRGWTRWVVAPILVLGVPAAADVSTVPSNPAVMSDVERAAAHVEGQEFTQARALLEPLVVRTPKDADAWSLLGFSLRKTGHLERARSAYARALELEPLHLGANEYAGEMWLEIGEVERARGHLAALETACPQGCEERGELAVALAGR